MSDNKPTVHGRSPAKIMRGISRHELLDLLACSGGSVTRVVDQQHKNAVLFTPQAFDELKMVTHLEQRHPDNATECQYILYGYYFEHPDKSFTTVVTRVIPLISALRECGFVQRSTEDDRTSIRHLSMQEQYLRDFSHSHNVDLKREAPLNPLEARFGPPSDVGEGHTHPGLGVFWSDIDWANVHARAGEPYINIVIDPHKAPAQVLAGMGPHLEACRVEFMSWDAPSAGPAPHAHSDDQPAGSRRSLPIGDQDLRFFCRHLRMTCLLSAAVLALAHLAAALLS